MTESDFITISTFNSMTEAQLAQAQLESAGVPCSLIHQTLNQVIPMHLGFMTIELIVARENAARAQELLSAEFVQEK
ncbi:MAG: DUF2007 domain-containing protein [Rikenellaceae bacterium]